MGAGLRPGEHATFGGQLANALGTLPSIWNQNIEGAIQHTGQGVGLGNVVMQQQARQAIAQMFPTISDDPDTAQRQYLAMAQAAAHAGLDADSQRYIGMANSIKDRQAGKATAVAPPEWYQQYNKAHPQPQDTTGKEYAQWLRERSNAAAEAGYPGSSNEDRQLALNLTNERLAVQREQGIGARFNQGLDFRQGQAFVGRSDIKPLIAQSNAYSQTYAVLDQAFKRNPAAYKSTAGNLAQTLDQKGQLRTTLFQIFSEFDPSLKGRFETWYDKWKEGGYPQYQLQDVKEMLDEARMAAVQKYTDAASEYQTAYPDAYIPAPETIFRVPAIGGSAPAPGRSTANDKYFPHP